MSPMLKPALCLVLLAVLLAGCGQKGPLYLPDETAPKKQTDASEG